MNTCADCGKPIYPMEASYARCDGGGFNHSACGDPFGLKAKDAEIKRLRAALLEIAENAFDIESATFAREILRTGA